MAMYDWNHDGNNDWKDNFIEYQLYHMQQEEKSPVPTGRGNGMSTFGAILSVVAGLVLQASLYVVLGMDVENVPVLVIVILWVVFSALAAVVLSKLGL